MLVVFTWMYLAPRHAGMICEALIASLWLTWPAEPSSRWYKKWLNGLTVAALVVVGLNQMQWTAHAVWDDIHKPYSGDEAMAQWLKTNEAGKRIAGFGYHSIGIAAWFQGPSTSPKPRVEPIFRGACQRTGRSPQTPLWFRVRLCRT
jgi:hypothetical protein